MIERAHISIGTPSISPGRDCLIVVLLNVVRSCAVLRILYAEYRITITT